MDKAFKLAQKQRQAKLLKKQAIETVEKTYKFIDEIEKVMALPESATRGNKIALLCNYLEMTIDSLAHFGLGMSFEKITNRYKTEITEDKKELDKTKK